MSAREATPLSVGVHTIAATDYHGDPCDPPSLSSSVATILCTKSPAHAWTAHPKLNPQQTREEKEHFDVGTAAHALLFEGEAGVTVVDAGDWRTKRAQELRDEARANGQLPLLEKHWAAVQAMVAALREQLDRVDARPQLFTDGRTEQTLVWEDSGVTCRARLDWLRDDHQAVDDYKTTSRSANPEAWSRALFGMGGDIQAAFYLRGLRALTGVGAQWRWVVQETTPPYALSVMSIGPDVLALAEKKVRYALEVWARCLQTDVWPAYPPRVAYAELPPWEEQRWLLKEEREFSERRAA